jgi:dihydrofolate reductase
MNGPRIVFVVAVARNGVIGRDGQLPWRIASDLKRFKEITMGKPVIMGRKTWESLPRKPLPGRLNVVMTRHRDYDAEGAVIASGVNEAIEIAVKSGADELCVIGGSEIFREFLPRATRIYLSEVDLNPKGDAFFPVVDLLDWQETSREIVEPGEKDDAGYTLRILDRINPIHHS